MKAQAARLDLVPGEGEHRGELRAVGHQDLINGVRIAPGGGGHEGGSPVRLHDDVGIEGLEPDAVHPVEREHDELGQQNVVLPPGREVGHGDGAGGGVGVLINLIAAAGERVIDLDGLPAARLPARQHDHNGALIVDTPALVLDLKILHGDLRPVLQVQGFARQAAHVRDLRGVERERAEEHHQQDRQMQQEAPVSAVAALAVDRDLADLLTLAALFEQVLAERIELVGREEHGVAHPGGTLRLTLRRLHDGADADDGAEREVQAQQSRDEDEVPALIDVVELQGKDRDVGGTVLLNIPGRLALLRDQRARHAAEGDKDQQEDAEAHRAQKIVDFLHKRTTPKENAARRAGGQRLYRSVVWVWGAQALPVSALSSLMAWLQSSSALSRQ